jgi:disulfide oxidoreductase YuzD
MDLTNLYSSQYLGIMNPSSNAHEEQQKETYRKTEGFFPLLML